MTFAAYRPRPCCVPSRGSPELARWKPCLAWSRMPSYKPSAGIFSPGIAKKPCPCPWHASLPGKNLCATRPRVHSWCYFWEPSFCIPRLPALWRPAEGPPIQPQPHCPVPPRDLLVHKDLSHRPAFCRNPHRPLRRCAASSWCLNYLLCLHRCWLATEAFWKSDLEPAVLPNWASKTATDFAFQSPMSYSQALPALRACIQLTSTNAPNTACKEEASAFTIHSLKVGLLSAAKQQRLPEDARRTTGHHKSSAELYGRDDTIDRPMGTGHRGPESGGRLAPISPNCQRRASPYHRTALLCSPTRRSKQPRLHSLGASTPPFPLSQRRGLHARQHCTKH